MVLQGKLEGIGGTYKVLPYKLIILDDSVGVLPAKSIGMHR